MKEALTRKLGPLPVWAWLIIGGVAGWYVYRKYAASSSAQAATSAGTQLLPSGGASPQDLAAQGAPVSAGSPSDTGSSTSDLLSAYGSETAQLTQALLTQSSQISQLAQNQLDYAMSATNSGSFATPTSTGTAPQPGTPNKPTMSYTPIVFRNPKTGVEFEQRAGGGIVERRPGGTWYATTLKSLPSNLVRA